MGRKCRGEFQVLLQQPAGATETNLGMYVPNKACNRAWIRTGYFLNTSPDYDFQLNLLDLLFVAYAFRRGLRPSRPLPASEGRIHIYVGSPTWYDFGPDGGVIVAGPTP